MDIGDNPANKIKIIKDGLSTRIYINEKEIPKTTMSFIISDNAIVNKDNVNHPSHYTTGKIEVIDFIEDNLGEGFEYYLVGNIMKYLCRYRHKNGVEDLKKAKWYLEKLIEVKEASK